MEINSIERERTSAFVLEVMDAPQIVVLARDSTDVQILTIDPAVGSESWFGQLPPTPAKVVADVRAVPALLAFEPGRSWIAQLSELSLALPAGQEARLVLPIVTELEPLGLRAQHVGYLGTTIAVLLCAYPTTVVPASALSAQVLEALAQAAVEADDATARADTAQRGEAFATAEAARRGEALAQAQIRAKLDRDALRAARRRKSSVARLRRVVGHPLTATRRMLGKLKRRLT